MSNRAAATPPRLESRPFHRTFHGDTVVDPYAWVGDGSAPQVRAHIDAENAYAAAASAPFADLAQSLFRESKAYLRDDDVDLPVRRGPYWYTRRLEAGQDYPRYTRLRATGWDVPRLPRDGLAPGEEVLLDGPAIAHGHEFFKVGGFLPAPDHSRFAALIDFDGGERMELHIRDAATGELVDCAVQGATYGLGFSADGRDVFYVMPDAAWRSAQVWRHRIGSEAGDELIFDEPDERFDVSICESPTRSHLVISSTSTTSGETFLLDLSAPEAGLRSVAPRQPGVEYEVEVGDDHLVVVHNRDNLGFTVATAPLSSSCPNGWSPLLEAGPGEKIEDVTFTRQALLVSLRANALPTLRVIPRRAGQYRPDLAFDLSQGGVLDCVTERDNDDPDAPRIRYSVSSMAQPESIYEYDPVGGVSELVHVVDVPGFRRENYREHRVWATAEDGTEIPISLVCRADMTPDGTHPGIIYGYGAYEVSINPTFLSHLLLPLVDRGIVFAIAHVRGGGELGRAWYLDGKLLKKRNTFTDFVACSRHLIESGWVSPKRLAASGGSAGGLLIGAAVNLAPDLYRAVHAAVPFVDALTTILNPRLPLTIGEWEEWGNPLADSEVYAYMKGYSPYENIAPCVYPAILASTSLNDVRVSFVEPLKWVARLRETVTNDPVTRPILLQCEVVAGHGGKSGRYAAIRQRSAEYAFLVHFITEAVAG